MESRVGVLDLTIRSEGLDDGRVRPAAEAFAIRVLQRCDEILEQRSPGRVFVLKHLDLSLRSAVSALEDTGEIDAFAAEIVDRLALTTTFGTDSEDGVAVFADEASWRAAHVEARATGSAGEMWPFAPLDDDGEPLRALVRHDRPRLLRDVLLCLHRRGTLLQILEPLQEDLLRSIARVLGQPEIDGTRESRASEDAWPEAVAHCVRDLAPAASPALAWIAIATVARDALGSSSAEAAVDEVARGAFESLLARRSTPPIDPIGAAGAASARQSEDERSGIAAVASDFGGVFYLLRLAIEVSLGESLWRACLPEGLVLARAIGVLLGDGAADDPAPLLFGGVRSNEALPPMSPEQQHEVSQAVFIALVEVLVRRELAAFCEPMLRLIETPHGRLLAASAGSSSYVLFALPANSREEIVAALDAFLAIWPPSAPPPRAGYALAALDRRSRIRSRVLRRPHAIDLLLANSDSLCTSALVTQAAGTLGHLFAARVRAADSSPRDLVALYLRIPALVATTSETIDVRMLMEAVNLDVRRAGLDADPVDPWLGRRVSLTFEEAPDSAGATGTS